MDLTTLTLEEFLREADGPGPEMDASDSADDLAGVFEPLVGELIRNLGKGYALHRLGDDPGDVALLANGQFAGFYHGETLAIGIGHKCKKLSVPLILEAVKNRPLPAERKLSRAGRAALALAWRVANGQAANPWP